ncbi:MAG: UDP-N-acetylmuramoyl-L-alanyl-D-glutamate--2,6-diaminopimelate ligase [Erysipelotrichaceae bacterium]|nr:UDP-N-acetylmuramoyl-L-alanyl-D-glutamate--2,6-diaminopimelate ligase [Erysipelotrichaceae bacterium]
MAKITLAKLLSKINVPCKDERIVLGISDDSRLVQKDWLFIARKGTAQDGSAYAIAAQAKGAVVLWEKSAQPDCYTCDDIDAALIVLLRTYYQNPCRHLFVVGVTGTNGKTSVTRLLAQMLERLQRRVMIIGTGHIRYGDTDIEINNTTPSACLLAYYIHLAKTMGYPAVIMEVSSHAIDQKRIGFLRFDHIIYTNVSSDHLDYHRTKTHYHYTKFKLRSYVKRNGSIIVNHDDASLHPLYDFYDHKIITVGEKEAHLQLSHIHLTPKGSSFDLEQIHYETSLIGYHNMMNIAQCLVVLHVLGIGSTRMQEIVAGLHGIAGRMERHVLKGRYVIIDYAHTASSLAALLAAVAPLKERNMIVVCGCGGERDRSKRSEMAQIALRYGDTTIFTSDNPRKEPPHQILYDMLADVKQPCEVFENRRYALKYAVKIAQERDIIVVAGKGDEHYQCINGRCYPFSDLECIKQLLEDKSYEP